MPSPQTSHERHSREGACEIIEIATFAKTPQRHSREGGNPFIKLEQALIWVPACAGTTPRPGLQPGRRFLHTLEGGNTFIALEQPTSMGPRLQGDGAAARITSV